MSFILYCLHHSSKMVQWFNRRIYRHLTYMYMYFSHKIISVNFVLMWWWSSWISNKTNILRNHLHTIMLTLCGSWCLTPLSTIFQLYLGRGNRRKPPTCRKWLTNFITQCCIKYISLWTGFELTTLVVIGTDCTCTLYQTAIQSRPQWPLYAYSVIIYCFYTIV
jgi:hypothetical protein